MVILERLRHLRQAAKRYSKCYFFLPSLLHPGAADNHETNN